MGGDVDNRVLVVAPGRDGELTCEILTRAGFSCVRITEESLPHELESGLGMLVVAEESLSQSASDRLVEMLDEQPAWSDLPVLLIASSGGRRDSSLTLTSRRSVSVLNRPMGIDSLVTAVRSALRARERQYEVRDLLLERNDAVRRKDDFLTMLAHELRNPLAPIRYGVQVLRSELPRPGGRTGQAIELVERQVAHMARLIADLLDVSRITRGTIDLKMERVDWVETTRLVLDARQGLARAQGLAMKFIAPQTSLWVQGDSARLAQMLDNLLDNAEKFSEPGGKIEVGLRAVEGGKRAMMWVRDEGAGIDPDTLAHLFEPFTQADRSLDRSRGGLGVGLTIVNGLVALHGGKVTASSDGVGLGSTFEITLPLAEAVSLAPNDAGPLATDGAAGLRILVVEDNPDALELLQMMLTLYGHTVEVAHTGAEAIEAAARFEPDVLVCDIGLPEMNGYEVARTLRQQARHCPSRLIAVTGYGGAEFRDEAINAGFDAHLVKPVNPHELLQELSRSSPFSNS